MKLLLLHLSDVHIRRSEDAILSRSSKIVDAVKNLSPDVSGVICAITGDIAYSGADAEYLLAIDFIDALKKGLEAQLPGRNVEFVLVPGNHDLDHSTPSKARDLILEEVLKSPDKISDASFSAICLAPLANYFLFFDSIGLPRAHTDKATGGKLFVQHRLKIGSHTVTLNCLNTATLSKLHEAPGHLMFPVELVQQPEAGSSLSISLLHHPYGWLAPQNAKAVRNRLEEMSDVILTGHEHVIDRRSASSSAGDNLYLEGGVLHDSDDPQKSQFFTIVIDLENRRQRLIEFTWNGSAYSSPVEDDIAQFHLWEDLLQTRLTTRRVFQPLDEFSEFLEDPELNLFHRRKQQLRLSDFYIFPDIRHVSAGSARTGKITKGPDVAGHIVTQPCALILGDDNAGKTALAKRLFSHVLAAGDIPIWIDLAHTKLRPNRVEEDIELTITKIYGPEALLPYRQADRSKRVLIIDNYHRLSDAGPSRTEILEKLREHSFRILATANDMELTLHEVAEGQLAAVDVKLPFEHYSILPFSASRRNAFIEKWLLIGGQTDASAVRFIQTLERINAIIQTLVGKNYVPAYPPYVLAVLQATEAGTEIDVAASTHGYLYELFIKTSIAKYASSLDYHIICEYLAHVAYWMASKNRRNISERELAELHADLQKRFEVLPSVQNQCEQLLQAHMMSRRNDIYAFKHSYIYYYFLAYYIRDRIQQPEVIDSVAEMTKRLHEEESANTLLFLSHLSKDHVILKLLLESATNQYKGVAEATLETDVKFINEIRGSVEQLTLPEKPFKQARSDYLSERDEDDDEPMPVPPDKELAEAINPITRLNSALKTIQILGQILKNFPVNLERAQKDEIMDAVTNLGRRSLSELLDITARNKIGIVTHIATIISKRKPNLSDRDLKERASTILAMMTDLATFGMILRMSYSIGSDRLTSIYDRYFSKQTSPAMRLILAALHLDHFEHFPESLLHELATEFQNNHTAFCILRQLAVRHFHIFPTDYRLRQRLSSLLKIDYKNVSIPNSSQRLIED